MADEKIDEELGAEGVPAEIEGEAVPAEEVPGTEPMGTGFELSIDEVPELQGLGLGEQVTVIIDSVSEDGKTFKLSVMPIEAPAPAEGAVGREAVAGELLE